MKKRIMSILLVVVMCVTMCIPSFASESDPVFTGPYAELKTSIYQQLKEQDKLEHFDLHLAALGLEESKSTMNISRSVNSQSWNASGGGVLSYTYDWTYRGESGYVTNTITYMTPTMTDDYRLGDYSSLGELISEAAGVAFSSTTSRNIFPALQRLYNKSISLFNEYTAFSIIGLMEDALVEQYVNNADGYGKLSAVYDSISDSRSKVLVGWDAHPTVTLSRSDAYDVKFC